MHFRSSQSFHNPEDKDFIVTKYEEEIALGRLLHGYDPDTLFSLIGHFRTAPLTVITRNGKRRVIVNHSFPQNKNCITLDNQPQNISEKIIFNPVHMSINTIIDSKKFQCAWGTFSECYLLVANAPHGTQAAIFDVDSAFHNIPIHPSARPFLAIMLKDRIHLDHVLNFGASPSPGIFSRVADAIVKIFLHRGIEAVIKWVDDFVFIRYPTRCLQDGTYQFRYTADHIWDTAAELGWPWAPKKFVDFSNIFIYIGFQWDFSAKIVELTETKKAKYLDRISTWTRSSTHTTKKTEVIIGTLNHVCLVVPEGLSHLVSLYKFRGGFRDGRVEMKHHLPANAAEDILWWQERLRNKFVGMKIFHPPPPLDNCAYVDASTSWGIGFVLDGRWLAWQFKEDWKSEGQEIGWAEMVAIELAIHTLITAKFAKCHMIIRSDNQGVVGAFKAGKSRGTQQNLILCEIVKLMQENEIWISTVWIPTSENPADAPSWGLFPGKKLLYTFPPKLPFHLTNYIHKAVEYHDSRI